MLIYIVMLVEYALFGGCASTYAPFSGGRLLVACQRVACQRVSAARSARVFIFLFFIFVFLFRCSWLAAYYRSYIVYILMFG